MISSRNVRVNDKVIANIFVNNVRLTLVSENDSSSRITESRTNTVRCLRKYLIKMTSVGFLRGWHAFSMMDIAWRLDCGYRKCTAFGSHVYGDYEKSFVLWNRRSHSWLRFQTVLRELRLSFDYAFFFPTNIYVFRRIVSSVAIVVKLTEAGYFEKKKRIILISFEKRIFPWYFKISFGLIRNKIYTLIYGRKYSAEFAYETTFIFREKISTFSQHTRSHSKIRRP